LLDYIEPEPMSGCWLWTASLGPKGYGQISAFIDGCRRLWRAHRLAWRLFRGTIPTDRYVLHSCDTPCCINPDHLWLGTQADNLADNRRKGRPMGRYAHRQTAA
jgi:hypothetical protein